MGDDKHLTHWIWDESEEVTIGHGGDALVLRFDWSPNPDGQVWVYVTSSGDFRLGRNGHWYYVTHQGETIRFRAKYAQRGNRRGRLEVVFVAPIQWRIRWRRHHEEAAATPVPDQPAGRTIP
ncbi:hypothetical protein ACYOEI_38995 [Singulisphaera rosea]